MSDPMATTVLLLLLLLVVVHVAGSSDGDALYSIARSLTNLPGGWGTGPDPCKWKGVKCTAGRVTSIDLNGASASGHLPSSSFTPLTSLQNLDLGKNQISGPIPSLSGLTSLQNLVLDGNLFDSLAPGLFTGLTALQTLSLDQLPLPPWSLPPDLADCSSLTTLSATNASLTGSIPPFLGTLPALTQLRISYNNLSGPLPPSFAGSSIQTLVLNNQIGPKLSGTIHVIASMPDLQLLWLQSNSFTGPIPDVSNLTSLQSFNVRDNQLTGPIPASLLSSTTLKNVTLSNNLLQGPVPVFPGIGSGGVDVDGGNSYCQPKPGLDCDKRVTTLLAVAGGFGYPLDLANTWEGNDPCNGWVGVTCDPSGVITVLNFANKHYSGVISPSIADLTGLTKIVLSDNDLSGTIPDSLTRLTKLQTVDVTNNSLSGKIPDFPMSISLKLDGNPNLGKDSGPSTPGGDNSGSTPGGAAGPSANGNQPGNSHSSNGAVIGGVIAAIAVLAGCVGCFAYFRHGKKRSPKFGRVETQSPSDEQEMIKIGMASLNVRNGAGSELYSQSSVDSANSHMPSAQGMVIPLLALRKATHDFSQERLLGKGGFGEVFKGEYNGTLIAVKRNISDGMSSKGMEEFRAEIDVLKKVRHRHLVALLGYTVEDNERILVYEYMSEGTLGQHLFDRHESSYSALNWNQRLTIALDVARGIEYLHSLAQESFIHRDLKPSNILLDKDMRAKVSDFGLVKLADNEKSMMTRLAGTFGYLAPEYALTGKVSTKVDVYAFGVILMEIITGRKALDESLPDEEIHLVTCFRRHILNREKFMNYVDPILDLDQEALRSMSDVAELARHCTAREPNQRPDMSHAVNVLSPLVDKWKPTSCDDEDNHGNSSLSLNQRLEKWQFDDGTSTMDLFSTYKGSQSMTHD